MKICNSCVVDDLRNVKERDRRVWRCPDLYAGLTMTRHLASYSMKTQIFRGNEEAVSLWVKVSFKTLFVKSYFEELCNEELLYYRGTRFHQTLCRVSGFGRKWKMQFHEEDLKVRNVNFV